MNFKRKLQVFLFLLLIIIPFNVFAYSDYIVVGGNNVGIEVNSKGIIVVGFYEVNNKNLGKDAGFQIGDRIVKIDDKDVFTINDMVDKINKFMKDDSIKITVLRNKIEKDIDLNLIKDTNNIYKTGLYVKNQITGIGTLTYIDPGTRIFGALGHEIIESNSNMKIEIKDGKIFKADITGITKSTENTTGEKNARFYSDVEFGTIEKNTMSGIFGKYQSEFNKDILLKVGEVSDIELGNAKVRTVLKNNDIEEYNINIISINKNSTNKNILFEIKDEALISKTNGIIKGMSGSPIIQNNMIIGAVTHAIVNDNKKGYGIFITTMLKEGEN